MATNMFDSSKTAQEEKNSGLSNCCFSFNLEPFIKLKKTRKNEQSLARITVYSNRQKRSLSTDDKQRVKISISVNPQARRKKSQCLILPTEESLSRDPLQTIVNKCISFKKRFVEDRDRVTIVQDTFRSRTTLKMEMSSGLSFSNEAQSFSHHLFQKTRSIYLPPSLSLFSAREVESIANESSERSFVI